MRIYRRTKDKYARSEDICIRISSSANQRALLLKMERHQKLIKDTTGIEISTRTLIKQVLIQYYDEHPKIWKNNEFMNENPELEMNIKTAAEEDEEEAEAVRLFKAGEKHAPPDPERTDNT